MRPIWTKQCLYLAILLVFSCNILSQEPSQLIKKDVTVDRSKPIVYLCYDKPNKTVKNNKEHEFDLRLVNNSIWTLRFFDNGSGSPVEIMTLPNGSRVPALVSSGKAFPRFMSKSENKPKWPDYGTVSYLPSDSFVTFTVPRKYLQNTSVYVEFAYSWELTGPIASDGNVSHRTYIAWSPSTKEPERLCK